MKRLILGVVAMGIASLDTAQFSDTFNRAEETELGTDWTEIATAMHIVSDQVQNPVSQNGLSLVTGVNVPVPTSVVSVDAFAVAGTQNHVAVVIGFAGVLGHQAIYAKIWDSDGDGVFDLFGLQGGNDGGGLPGALTVPTASARISVWSDTPDSYTMGIDRDFDGVIDETHTVTNMLIWGTGLGTGIGLGIRGGAIADNFSQGLVFPNPDTLPDSFTIVRGVLNGGGLSDLSFSDDSRLDVRAGLTLFLGESPLQVVFTGTSPVAVPSELRFTLETNSNTPGLTQEIQLWNYSTSVYDSVDLSVPGFADSSVQIVITTTPENYIQSGTMEMKAKMIFRTVGLTLLYPWSARTDQAVWATAP